ncbi:hypothetical protein [Sphingomonas sp. RS2018]
MDWGGPGFVIAIIAITTGGWIINNWIRAKHGFEPTDDWGMSSGAKRKVGRINRALTGRDDDELDDDRKIALLTTENERLTGKVGRLEERIAVLERIATDPAERTAREIDALR